MKYCYKCKTSKDINEFNKNHTKKDGFQTICKQCSSYRRKEYYLKNKLKEIDTRKKYSTMIRSWFKEYKKTLKCSCCGDARHYVLDFHHVDNKNEEVSRLVSNKSKKKILEEINKCTVLCAN